MTVKLRNRCIVLNALSITGPTDSESLSNRIGSDLTIEQVRRAIYTLLEDDEIFKVRQVKREGRSGRPSFVYDVKDAAEPKQPKKTGYKKGRKTHSESLQRSPQSQINSSMSIVLYRDRKIRLLKKLIQNVDGPDKDLIFGMLADFGCSYSEANITEVM